MDWHKAQLYYSWLVGLLALTFFCLWLNERACYQCAVTTRIKPVTFDAGEGITLTYDETSQTYTARITSDPKPQISLFVGPGVDMTYDEPNNVVRAHLSDTNEPVSKTTDPNCRDTWPGVVVPQTAEPPITWRDVEVLWTNQGDSPRP